MNINSPKRRKAISPVLATVILIAITLIAAIAIAGFVFGLFGSFTSSAQVSASVSSCHANGTTEVCTLTLTNTGTSNVAETACTIQVSGAAASGAFVYGKIGAVLQTNIPAGTSQFGATCTVTTAVTPAIGSQAIGSLALSNGASVPYSGVWS